MASDHSIMSQAIPYIVKAIKENSIQEIAAVINRNNIAARRVLEKADFKYYFKFDFQKDLYNHFVENIN